jgi:hypothetical protein
MAWDTHDTALTIQGVGSLASAWGQYKTEKERNKILDKQLAYEQKKDALAESKSNLAQDNYNSAFEQPIVVSKKKKYDADGNEIVENV